ncbi:MAG TPA: thermonuclease family protein [Syntrophorhabdaceae bacterium]|nr:thermonuclease family protein [Syntrophorhabdaceae bacterium]HOL05255.1 thermonuclease family protein [Syntrophorhabdaceae bacterium]HON84838.1 thermonuclease family protein [Syntrophorhabdaceae bacterium]HOT41901.1 thermonuclease family protein [Syntrophorhabdaceae bacterium]HPC66416.1 thermonuclease family protein [Syntrophorhabdaceae bacterium]
MKRVLFLFLVFAVLFISPCFGKENKEYTVTKVIDGDTIQLDTGEIVRYIGVDAPELHTKTSGPEFYAKEAARFNKRLVFLKKVTLEFDVERKDQYGRLLAYVFVKKTFVNGELVRLGYARAFIKPPNLKYKDLLLTYQQKAMDEERGLWQEKKKDTETLYIGNKRTYILHRPSCPLVKKISDKNRITFKSRVDAIRIGYTPCRQCRP